VKGRRPGSGTGPWSSRSFHLRATGAALFLASGSLLFACDGESSGAGADVGATAADVSDLCEATCGRQQRCNGDPAPTCVPDCADDFANAAQHTRADMLRALGACHDRLECGSSDDGCVLRAMEDVGIVPEEAVEAADFKACKAKQNECQGTAFSFSGDECATLIFMTSSSRPKAAACYQKSCEETRDCIAPYELR